MNKAFLFLLFTFPILVTAQVQERNSENKWGTTHEDGSIRIPFVYDELSDNNRNDIYIAKKDNKFGLIDKDGKEVIPLEYFHITEYLQPFGWQSGYYVVSREETDIFGDKDSWGVINEKNEVIIPLKYRYVRCLDSNLIVTRFRTDTLLNFFSGKGELLYQIPGRKLYEGFDNNTYEVHQLNRNHRMAYRTGEWVLPEELGRCYWTDGKTYLVYRNQKSGAIDRQGNIKIPFDFTHLKNIQGEDYFFGEGHLHKGVYNLQEGITIPVKFYIENFGAFYLHHDQEGKKLGVLDKNGKVVFPLENRATTPRSVNNLRPRFKIIENLETRLQAIINRDGEVVLPQKFNRISYASDFHPLLTMVKSGEKERYEVYDIKGNKLLKESFGNLNFTANPNILIASKETYGPYGLLLINQPDSLELKYKRIEVFQDSFLNVRNDKGYQLFSSDGKTLNDSFYRQISTPDKNHLRAFNTTKNTTGKLIAVARSLEKPYTSSWIGLNEQGAEFYFEK